LFARADADNDGVLTVDEIRKVAQAQAAPGGRGEGRGEGRGGEGRGGPGGMTFMRIDPILAALDADGDGVISSEELLKAPQSLLKLDKNQDGKLSEEEVRPAFGRGPGAGRERNQ
jgi:Ca2+-binding EF-hand superfamily protein